MAFDPTKPVEDSLIESEELRNQFNGLKDLITASRQFRTFETQKQIYQSHDSPTYCGPA